MASLPKKVEAVIAQTQARNREKGLTPDQERTRAAYEAVKAKKLLRMHHWRCGAPTKKHPVRSKKMVYPKKPWHLKEIRDTLKAEGCTICGCSKCLAAVEFHHLDPEKKTALVGEIKNTYDLLQELKNCVVLCMRCHRELHHGLFSLLP